MDGAWIKPRLEELFTEGDVKRILDMSVSLSGKDTWMWPYTHSGEYTVKIGYAFIEREKVLLSSEGTELNQIKQRIWKLHSPPKIKFFFWQAVSGALAVAERLQSRGIPMDVTCKICNLEVESISHVLFGCLVDKRILFLAGIPFPPQGFSMISIFENMDFLLQVMCNKQLPPV